MTVDVEADIAAYARRQKAEQERRWKADHPDALRQMRARYRAKHKTPARITYTPPPTTTHTPIPDWRTQLDARISRCAGCDQWQWDRMCQHCMTQTNPTSRRAA